MRPLLAMLATSLSFAPPALAMEKGAHSTAVQTAAPKLGAVTFTANDGSNGKDRSEMMTVLTVGGEAVPQKLTVTRPDNFETDYAMRFRAVSELDGTAALQVFVEVCEMKRVEGQEIARLHAAISIPNCRSVEQILSIPDGKTVPLIVNATGKPLGTLTWNTMPSAPTTSTAN